MQSGKDVDSFFGESNSGSKKFGKANGKYKSFADKAFEWLDQPVHPSSLCLFRLVYGLVMSAQIWKWADMFIDFQGSVMTFPYAGTWVKPVGPFLGNIILMTCFISSLFVAVGLYTKISSIITFSTFIYLFHICESYHNNHYILMCHINFISCFLSWGKWASLDAVLFRKKNPKASVESIPYWNLFVMQMIFCIPYFYGSIAKMNSDWLFRAQPVTAWFGNKEGYLYHQWWFSWFIAWSGMFFDMTISFLLLNKKTRFIMGFPGALCFNISNKLMFNIGVFPYAMICSLVLFLDPHFPSAVWNMLNGLPPPIIPTRNLVESKDQEDSAEGLLGNGSRTKRKGTFYKRFVLIFMGGFALFHCLFPLRHFVLYESNPSWTEEGHIGAWHMKLRSKHGWAYLITEDKNGDVLELIPELDPYITSKQRKKMITRPHGFLLYVGRLAQIFEEAGRPLKSVRVRSCYSLNVNPERELYISSANLLDYVGKYEVIGVTGIHKWIHPYASAPLCNFDDNPRNRPGLSRRVKDAFWQLYGDAHFHSDAVASPTSEYLYYRVMHRMADVVKKHTVQTYAYIWKR